MRFLELPRTTNQIFLQEDFIRNTGQRSIFPIKSPQEFFKKNISGFLSHPDKRNVADIVDYVNYSCYAIFAKINKNKHFQ